MSEIIINFVHIIVVIASPIHEGYEIGCFDKNTMYFCFRYLKTAEIPVSQGRRESHVSLGLNGKILGSAFS